MEFYIVRFEYNDDEGSDGDSEIFRFQAESAAHAFEQSAGYVNDCRGELLSVHVHKEPENAR